MIKVVLASPLKTARGGVSELYFREPQAPDFCGLGPATLAVSQRTQEAIDDYLRVASICIMREYVPALIVDVSPASLCSLSLRDTLKIHHALQSVFLQVEAEFVAERDHSGDDHE